MFSDGRHLHRPVAFQHLPPVGVRGGHIFPDTKGKNSAFLPSRRRGVV